MRISCSPARRSICSAIRLSRKKCIVKMEGDWEPVEKGGSSSMLILCFVHNDGGKYLSGEFLREVRFQKRLDPRRKREMIDFLNEVLASHCLPDGDPCKVAEL